MTTYLSDEEEEYSKNYNRHLKEQEDPNDVSIWFWVVIMPCIVIMLFQVGKAFWLWNWPNIGGV